MIYGVSVTVTIKGIAFRGFILQGVSTAGQKVGVFADPSGGATYKRGPCKEGDDTTGALRY